jgi:hypothetical protein
VDNLTEPLLVQLPQLERPGQVWMEAVWTDPATSVLYGWYHFEPADLDCQTAPIIGAAMSFDAGLSWIDRGFVISSAYDIDCEYDNGYFVGGSGDFSVLLGPNGRFFYFLFSNYAGPIEQQGVAVARSLAIDRGQPGTVLKFHGDAWSQPGLGGEVTPVFGTDTGWRGPYVDALWGPSLHWNTYLGSYVVLLNRTAGEQWAQEGIYISFSQNLTSWTLPQKLLESNDWYPQVLGLGEGETDSRAGQFVRIFVGGVSTYMLEFKLPAEARSEPSAGDGVDRTGDQVLTHEVEDDVALAERELRRLQARGRDELDLQARVAVDRAGHRRTPGVYRLA